MSAGVFFVRLAAALILGIAATSVYVWSIPGEPTLQQGLLCPLILIAPLALLLLKDRS